MAVLVSVCVNVCSGELAGAAEMLGGSSLGLVSRFLGFPVVLCGCIGLCCLRVRVQV